MIIIANGRPREVLADSTVGSLLETLRLPPEQVVVEHNGEPLQRSRFANTRLAPNDRLEIAQMVGGG
ncbi:MAG TPA: sulfur carrier protein ThiS [Candidatus Eremiobacteraceae bacterium]|nr:sulfur carrier protein ThiS [Candidatus Eremiobacteraceae bacterium]